jgi:hypothetical protein
MARLKAFLILLVIGCADAFLLWTVTMAGKMGPLFGLATGLVFLFAPLGAIWMLYDTARYERSAWPYILWVVIPYFFVWHYFRRYRKRRSGVARSD